MSGVWRLASGVWRVNVGSPAFFRQKQENKSEAADSMPEARRRRGRADGSHTGLPFICTPPCEPPAMCDIPSCSGAH